MNWNLFNKMESEEDGWVTILPQTLLKNRGVNVCMCPYMCLQSLNLVNKRWDEHSFELDNDFRKTVTIREVLIPALTVDIRVRMSPKNQIDETEDFWTLFHELERPYRDLCVIDPNLGSRR